MQGDDAHADHVLPEEGVGEEVLAKHDLLPNRARDHDGVEHEGFDDDGDIGRRESVAGPEIPEHEPDGDRHNEELDRREDPLNERPLRGITTGAFLWRI